MMRWQSSQVSSLAMYATCPQLCPPLTRLDNICNMHVRATAGWGGFLSVLLALGMPAIAINQLIFHNKVKVSPCAVCSCRVR